MSSIYALPENSSDRHQTFDRMVPETQELLLALFNTKDQYVNGKDRKKPLEDWIVRYDKVMGFQSDCIDMMTEIGVTMYGDPRVDLYLVLEQLVEESTLQNQHIP